MGGIWAVGVGSVNVREKNERENKRKSSCTIEKIGED